MNKSYIDAQCCNLQNENESTAPQAFDNDQKQELNLYIEGLDCADCASKLSNTIKKQAGVYDASLNFSTTKLSISFDSLLISKANLIKQIEELGYQARDKQEQKSKTTVFKLSGLDCGDCALKLEKRLATLENVFSVKVNFASSKMTVTHAMDDSQIINIVSQSGYKAAIESRHETQLVPWWKKPKMIAVCVSGALLISSIILSRVGVDKTITTTLYALVMIIGGFHLARSAFYSVKSLTFDMNFLMVSAATGAAIIGEWSEGATVVFLFSFGNALQAYTIDKTRNAIRALMELAPPEAIVIKDNVEVLTKVEDIQIDDLVIIKPGERIAVDGVVSKGVSAVNQAPITGESMPVDKTSGDNVYAGTMNINGTLEVTVTKKVEDTTLAKIMHSVEEAQAEKAPMQHFVDVFAKYYTPIVIVVAIAVAMVPPLVFGGEFSVWFYRALVLLVISCPCALVISTPVSIVSAIGNSSRNGVLVKGGIYMEKLGQIKAIAFDKTGTLTKGKPQVTDIISFSDSYTKEQIIQLAAGVEKWSEHPIGVAIYNHVKNEEIPLTEGFTAIIGKGAKANYNGKVIFIGNMRLFEEIGCDTEKYKQILIKLEEEGKSAVFIGDTSNIYGVIAVADSIRDTSIKAIQSLKDAKINHIAILTGDNERTAKAIANSLGIENVYSNLLPEDKASALKDLKGKYGNIAMVGDGVNDAPALAYADVGIAMGVAGSDTAIETSDIALMADDLNKLAYIIKLSRKTLSIIKQNITFSVAIKVVFLAGTFFGFVNLWLAVIADTGASLIVTLNGMRLIRKIKL